MRKRIVLFFLIMVLLFGASIPAFAAAFDASLVPLTEPEQNYFSRLKTLRVLTAPGMQPYAYQDMGVSLDIVRRLCQSAGIALEVIEAESYADALMRLENGEAELAAVKVSLQADTGHILPYLNVPLQMVYHNQINPNESSNLSLVQLQGLDFFNGKENSFAAAINVPSVQDCLNAVRSRLADVFLCDVYQLSVFSANFTAWDMAVTTIPHYEIGVGFGLGANTDPMLISALQRTVDTFATAELSALLISHTQYRETGLGLIQFVYQHPFELFCMIISLFFVVLICVYVFFRIRSSQHQELRGYEESYRMLAETFGEAGLKYDYLSDRLTFFGGRRNRIDIPESIEQAHTALGQGVIRLSLTPTELDTLLLNNAQDQSYQVELRCGMKEGNWNWFRMIYIVVCTSESHRRPIRLIGCLVNIEKEYQEKERLLKIGHYDQLTGLLNRASGELEMMQALESDTTPKVLLFLDIDCFKSFNDLYGHSCGDAVLNALGAALCKIFSPDDILCRWGGDEFILLIKGEGAQEHKLSSSLRKLQKTMQSVSYLDNSLSVTLSIGGTFACPELSFQALFELADATLYAVKNEGRNCFRINYEMMGADAPSKGAIK